MSEILMPCVILSGGRGSRLGQLKQNLAFLDSTLADFMAGSFKECFENVYFSAKLPIENSFGITTILDTIGAESELNANILQNKENFAPIFGLQSVLEFLQSDFFAISIDAPCFGCVFAREVINAYKKSKKSTFVKNSKIHPLIGVYSLSVLPIIREQISKKDYKLLHLLDRIGAEFINIDEDKTQNINTSKDYEKIHKTLKERR